MDHMRIHEILEELSDYDGSVKAGRIMSTVTLGEIVELALIAETVERQTEQIERMLTGYADDQEVLKGLEQERDAALAEVERLKDELRGIYNDQAAAYAARRGRAL